MPTDSEWGSTPTYSSEEDATPAYSEGGGGADYSDGKPAYLAAATPVGSPVASPASYAGADPYTYPGSTPEHTACADDVEGGEAGLLPTVEPTVPTADVFEAEETAVPAEYEDATPTSFARPGGHDGDATPAPYSGPYGFDAEAPSASDGTGSGVDVAPGAPTSTPGPSGYDEDALAVPTGAGPYGDEGVEDNVPYEYGFAGAATATPVPYAPVASATPAPYGADTGGGSPTPTTGPYGGDGGDVPAVTTGAGAYGDDRVDGEVAVTPSPSPGLYGPAAGAATPAPGAPTYGAEGPAATATAVPYASAASATPAPYGDGVGDGPPAGIVYGPSVHE